MYAQISKNVQKIGYKERNAHSLVENDLLCAFPIIIQSALHSTGILFFSALWYYKKDQNGNGGIVMAKENTVQPGKTLQKGKLLAAVLLFLAVLAVCVLYIRRSTLPLERFEIGPASDPGRWQFTLTDGTLLSPEDGILPVEGSDTVVICETVLTGITESDVPLMVVASKSSDCVFFLDGQMIYSPTGRYQDGAFSDAEFTTASGQFGLPGLDEGQRLTMIVQLQGEENRLSRMPKLTLYPSAINYYSQYTGPVAEDALPAGVYFAAALFLAGLFLIGQWKRNSDPGLILLAFCALSMAFLRTASYSYGAMSLFNTPTITWFTTVLPLPAMSWTLWRRLSKKMRLLALPLIGIVTAAMLALFFIGLDNMDWVNQMHLMTAWVLPGLVLAMLAASIVDAVKGNLQLRRFFVYFAWAIPAVGIAWGFSALTGGKLTQNLQTAFTSIVSSNPMLYYLGIQLCNLLLILCFIQALLELIGSMARQDAEMQAMALRERYAAENLEIMRQSQEETRRQRHEMRHHLTLLTGMLSQKQDDRASDYIQSLLGEMTSLPSDSYSDNMVINAIAGHYLNAAKSEGVRVETDIRVKTGLPLKDEELCIVLTNLLENALEACRDMKQEQERFISLAIFSDSEHLHITCENSTDVSVTPISDGPRPSSKSDSESHGYGLPAIHRIVEKHYGTMTTGCNDECFTVKITL